MIERLPELTKREWEIMNVCWKKKQLTIQEIIDNSPEENKRHYQTLNYQLEVLVRKGYLIREKKGPLWLYSPKITKKEIILKEAYYYVGYIINGYLCPTFINFMENKKISRVELSKLKEMINNLPEDDKIEPERKDDKKSKK